MKHATELKLQAWLDHELPPREAEAVAAAAGDPEGQALLDELRVVKSALAAGELARTVPETREFYWSKIERAILSAEAQAVAETSHGWRVWFLRFVVPVGITGVLALLLTLTHLHHGFGATRASGAEIDSPLDDISSLTFRSESEGITVVWVNTH